MNQNEASSFERFSLVVALVALSNGSFEEIQVLQNTEQCYPVPRNTTMKFTNKHVYYHYQMYFMWKKCHSLHSEKTQILV